MTVLTDLADLAKQLDGLPFFATIGYFDGVHLGHRALAEQTAHRASEQGCALVIITLDHHPQEVLRPDLPPPDRLMSLQNKLRILGQLPGDAILLLRFTKELAAEAPEQFLRPLIEIGLKGLVLGYDNRFGRREPHVTLRQFDDRIRSQGVSVHRIDRVFVGDEGVSSTAIRAYIRSGDFEQAARMLGRPYSFVGDVVSGSQIGRTLSYPTANIRPIDPHLVMPEDGIFVSEVKVGEYVYPAMAYYGCRPTIAPDLEHQLEAFLFGYSGSLYGRQVEIAFRSFLRQDIAFATREELAEQLVRDEAATKAYFADHALVLR